MCPPGGSRHNNILGNHLLTRTTKKEDTEMNKAKITDYAVFAALTVMAAYIALR